MADIYEVTLPSGNTYTIQDKEARELIANLNSTITGGVHYRGKAIGISDAEGAPVTGTQVQDEPAGKDSGFDLKDEATNQYVAFTGGGTMDMGSTYIYNADYKAETGDMVSYDNVMYIWNGEQWDELGSAGELKELAYKDSVEGTSTPKGSIKNTVTASGHTHGYTPSGKISTGTGTANYTPSGTVSSTFTGKSASHSHSFTPSGSVEISTGTGTANYTPKGTNTGGAVSLNTTSVTPISAVGTLPSYTDNTFTVSNGTLTIGAASFNAGTLPTKGSAVTVATGVKSVTQPTFTGTGANLTGKFTGTAGTTGDKSVTPSGDIKSEFVGTGADLEFTGTKGTTDSAKETVSVTSEFTGTKETITSK